MLINNCHRDGSMSFNKRGIWIKKYVLKIKIKTIETVQFI